MRKIINKLVRPFKKSRMILVSFIITVFSNLSIVDKYIDLFCEYPPFMISASIYGLSNKDYLNFTRQENQFEVIERNIEALIFHGIELKLKVIVTVNNYQDIFDGKYELFAQKHKCSIFYDSNIFSNNTDYILEQTDWRLL